MCSNFGFLVSISLIYNPFSAIIDYRFERFIVLPISKHERFAFHPSNL